MRVFIAGIVAAMALAGSVITAMADAKECRPGYEYDEAKGKCVIIRGS